jgi:hypothetical protein
MFSVETRILTNAVYEWSLQNAISQIIQSVKASRSHCPSEALHMQGMPGVLSQAAKKNH